MNATRIFSRIFMFFGYAIIAAAMGMILFISYLIFFSTEVLEVRQQPLPARPLVVHPGDAVFLKLDYCKHKDIPSKITLDFEGDYVIPSLSTVRHFALGCHVIELPFTMPLSSKAGTYRVLVTVTYRVNPLNVQPYEFYSQPIEVVDLPVEEGK